MEYISSRCPEGRSFTFQETLLAGYAPDGGLFMPRTIPQLDKDTLRVWAGLSYPDLVVRLCQLYISDQEVPHSHLEALIKKALRVDMIREKHLADGCMVLELYHGKTLAFKDLAMSVTAALVDYFLAKKNDFLNIIVSTSGDTGAAAIEAFGDSSHADVFVMYPLDRVTEIQQLQMTTAAALSGNIHLFGLSGTSDDGDEVMKAIFQDKQFATDNHVSNVNSINWCRVMVQAAHHFYAYLRASPACDEIVEVVCPTGAAGNLAAGCLAFAMGLAIKLVAAVNLNDLVYQMIASGQLTIGPVHKTLASAMDIQMPYNIERILHILSNGSKQIACDLQASLDSATTFVLPKHVWKKVAELFTAFKCTDDIIRGAIRQAWEEESYLVCPHTATALAYHFSRPHLKTSVGKDTARVCLATASYIKFPEALSEAGVPLPNSSLMDMLRAADQQVTRLEDKTVWLTALRISIQESTAKRLAH